ncbi:hypothetical protein [Ammoniphilus sp. 3BR4]|uniref:hypothetical protein n=1 Tax=Ammoniphilus sp. 3BR4 TaxID=3158265 RepID=UPI0034656FFF
MVLKYSSLKEKDLDYLSFILRHGVVTANQMMLKFREPNVYRVYRRLRKLEDRGYVKHQRIAHKVGVYYGTIEARDLTHTLVTVPTKATIYTMQHNLLMTDLILYYEFQSEKQGIGFDYQTEREIRHGVMGDGDHQSKLKAFNENRDRIPDAIFHFRSPDGRESTTWIELELNKKDRKRYEEKFQLFEKLLSGDRMEGLIHSFHQVMYFTNDTKVQNVIHEVKKKLINGNKIVLKKIPSVILEEKWEEVMPNGTSTP